MKVRSLILLFMLICCTLHINAQQREAFILYEDFEKNRLGWVEEFTDSHYTGIRDGFLYIVSKDTSKDQTSNCPQNTSFLWDMPSDYEITASFSRLKDNRSAHFGIILNSASLFYKFTYSDSCIAEVTEYDYNKETETALLSKKFGAHKLLDTESANFTIRISGRKFIFLINNQTIGNGELNSRSWINIRLYVSSGSTIKIDYLRIKKADQK
jgi:hypothetical protein